jgi:hypothetical protein
VRQHFPDLPRATGSVPYARNYLEKLIQVPFRIPALGTHETRIYVLLLLIESIVGADHAGFQSLLVTAKEALNRPWLGAGLTQAEVQAVDATKRESLDAAFVLAARIGPVLGEGTKGNPRQIKRFLNALLVREAIARARGFGDLINQSALAKLMLAERFQPDFYEHLATRAVGAADGKAVELRKLEAVGREDRTPRKAGDTTRGKDQVSHDRDDGDQDSGKWLEREWLQRWVRIEPALGDADLRPYVFVARDKRILAGAGELGDLEVLIEKLSASGMAIRMVEPEVKALPASDAEAVFAALRERVLQSQNFSSPPAGFEGLGIVAKHHARFQGELVALLGSLDAKTLGIWIVRGWNEVLTDRAAQGQLRAVITQWAKQDENALLKRAAGQALASLRTAGR